MIDLHISFYPSQRDLGMESDASGQSGEREGRDLMDEDTEAATDDSGNDAEGRNAKTSNGHQKGQTKR